jgi:hypothetical protein
MADFLLLGLVPGTHIQITFTAWLYCLIILVMVAASIYLKIRKQPFLTASIYFAAWQANHSRP